MSNEIIRIETGSDLGAPQGTTDERLIDLWLHGRSPGTQRGYRAEANRFLADVRKPLMQVALGDLQAWADCLEAEGLEPATRRRMLAAIKSLISFGFKLGYLPFDTGKPLRLPALRDTLAERILDETTVLRMIALEPKPRNAAILTLLYAAGLRVSELCGLRWKDLQARNEGGQVTVFGKGSKTRTILLPAKVYERLVSLRGDADDDAPVFRSRKGGHLDASQVLRITHQAAKRAGVNRNVRNHDLRHCHASHSLERGAPISLVSQTLGHTSVGTTGRYLHARPNDSSSRYLPL